MTTDVVTYHISLSPPPSGMKTKIVISNQSQINQIANKGFSFPSCCEDDDIDLVVDPYHSDEPSRQELLLRIDTNTFNSLLFWGKENELASLCLNNCIILMQDEVTAATLFNRMSSIHPLKKFVLSNTKFQTNFWPKNNPWRKLGLALAKLQKLETLQLSYIPTDLPASLFGSSNFRRNRHPLKEFCYHNFFDLQTKTYPFSERSNLADDFRNMMIECQKCSNLEILRIGKFLDGNLSYPVDGNRFGFVKVRPVTTFHLHHLRWRAPSPRVQEPFAEMTSLLNGVTSLKNLKRLDIQACTIEDLSPIINCLEDNNTVEELIVRCDGMRLNRGFQQGKRGEELCF